MFPFPGVGAHGPEAAGHPVLLPVPGGKRHSQEERDLGATGHWAQGGRAER